MPPGCIIALIVLGGAEEQGYTSAACLAVNGIGLKIGRNLLANVAEFQIKSPMWRVNC